MSYTCNMVIDTGGKELATVAEVRNVTWSNSGIFRALGVRADDLRGLSGKVAEPVVAHALDVIRGGERADELKALEPSNGWGGVEDATDFLVKLLAACEAHPKATVEFY